MECPKTHRKTLQSVMEYKQVIKLQIILINLPIHIE